MGEGGLGSRGVGGRLAANDSTILCLYHNTILSCVQRNSNCSSAAQISWLACNCVLLANLPLLGAPA